MNKTFRTMKLNVANNIQDTSTAMLEVIGVYLNSRFGEIRQRLDIYGNDRTDYTFSTVSGTRDYILPDDFNKETKVLDVTNNIELGRITTQEWVESNASNINSSGTATKYIIFDDTVRKQPTLSVVTIISDSLLDSGTIHVRGLVDGVESSENIVLNGTTSVNGTILFNRITGVSKSGVTTGTITVYANYILLNQTVLTIMPPTVLISRVKKMRLTDTPNSVVTIQVFYIPKQMPLYSDYDYTDIDCDEALEAGATADAWRYKRQFAKAQSCEALFEKALANLAFNMANQPNLVNRFNPKPYSRNIY